MANCPVVCKDCQTLCNSFSDCKKMQEFQIIVESARAMARLRKIILTTVPHFRGKTAWLTNDGIQDVYEDVPINELKIDIPLVIRNDKTYYKMFTITFDPKKFSFNELTQPKLLDNYIKKSLYELKKLYKEKTLIIVREFHKSGIPHYHILLQPLGLLEQHCLELRLRYYFAQSIRNKSAVHVRHANELATNYVSKSATTFSRLKEGFNIPKKDTNSLIVEL